MLLLPLGAALLTELAAPGFLMGLLAAPLPAALVAVSAALQVAGLLTIRRVAMSTAGAP